MQAELYCKKCILKNSHPGIHFDSDGICSACNLELPEDYVSFYEYSFENYLQFEKDNVKNRNSYGNYDCVLGLSGGKDSIYMLKKMISEKEKKVLAYTFIAPFESAYALKNIEKVMNRLDVEHVTVSANKKYLKLIKHAFGKKIDSQSTGWRDERDLCLICSHYMYLNMCCFALSNNIPYVIVCADPMQAASYNTNLKQMIKKFMSVVDTELCHELFGDMLERLLKADPSPRIIFPYLKSGFDYNADRIISELKQEGLYESNPVGTHCGLFPLINLYAYKNYNCMFYSLDYASKVRMNDLSRDDFIKFDKELKDILFVLAGTGKNPDNQVSDFVRMRIKEMVSLLKMKPEESIEFEKLMLLLPGVMRELDLTL